MNSAEKEAVLHCLKVTIDEALCEDCPLYGTTGTYLCEKDCARLAINVLEQEPCTDAISREDALMALTGEYTDSPIELLPKAIKRINALPPVTPQYTEAEIQRMQELEQAEIQKAYEIGKEEGSSEKPNKWIDADVLDKIRAEIADLDDADYDYEGYYKAVTDAVKIIDKYKASSIGVESDDKCKECKKDWTKCGKCPVMMKWVKEHKKEDEK